MANESSHSELKTLILAQLDGSITEAQYRRLQELLNADREHRRYYAEYVTLCAALRRHGQSFAFSAKQEAEPDICDRQLWSLLAENERTAPEVEVATAEPAETKAIEIGPRTPEKKKISRLSLCAAAGSLAAMIGLFVFVLMNSRSEPLPVGYLAGTIETVWPAGQEPILEGDLVRTGPITLESGLAEVVLDGGARVVLEGPVRVEVTSASELFVERGKLSVLVQTGREGFVVNTPGCRVVDFGTEFGVFVSAAGVTETHVRQGRVQLQTERAAAGRGRVLDLAARQAGQARLNGTLQKVPYQETEFVYEHEFAVRVKGREESGYHRWLAQSYRLRRNPDLVLYYPFLAADTDEAAAINYAAGTGEAADGTFGGTFGISNFVAPAWDTGRWPQKAALRFDRDRRTCVAVPESAALNRLETMTLTAWVQCPDQRKGGHLLSCRQAENVNYQFGCFSQEDPYYANQFQFLRTGEPAAPQVYSSRRFEWTGEWTFLAVTYDGQTACFYVNGRRFESVPYAAAPPAVSAPLFIGDVPAFDRRTFGYAAFHGLIDEIAVFKRSLTAEEIQHMHEAGKP